MKKHKNAHNIYLAAHAAKTNAANPTGGTSASVSLAVIPKPLNGLRSESYVQNVSI